MPSRFVLTGTIRLRRGSGIDPRPAFDLVLDFCCAFDYYTPCRATDRRFLCSAFALGHARRDGLYRKVQKMIARRAFRNNSFALGKETFYASSVHRSASGEPP